MARTRSRAFGESRRSRTFVSNESPVLAKGVPSVFMSQHIADERCSSLDLTAHLQKDGRGTVPTPRPRERRRRERTTT